MLSPVPTVTFIAIECLDVAATLAAAWLLLRMVVARPAVGRSRRVVENDPVAAEAIETPLVDVPPAVDLDAYEVEDGITWPEPVWRRLAA